MRINSAIIKPATTIAMTQESRFKSLRIFSIAGVKWFDDKGRAKNLHRFFPASQRRMAGFPRREIFPKSRGNPSHALFKMHKNKC